LTVRKDGLGKQSCLTSTREVIIYFTLVLWEMKREHMYFQRHCVVSSFTPQLI
jgi:hypothetical protein